MKNKILMKCMAVARKNNNPVNHPEYGNYIHYSFIIQKNRIVDWGTNRRASALTNLDYLPYQKMHSEVDAYFRAKGIMIKNEPFEMVNIRLTKTFRIRHSNPCRCCYGFLKNLNCKRVWFTTDLGVFASLSF